MLILDRQSNISLYHRFFCAWLNRHLSDNEFWGEKNIKMLDADKLITYSHIYLCLGLRISLRHYFWSTLM